VQVARAYVALGSNLGDRRAHIEDALAAISKLPLTRLVARSDLFETAPVSDIPQGPYLNAAAAVDTFLAPRDLLDALLAIEHSHARDRSARERWGPRTLDLDLLTYGDTRMHIPGLTLPHPRLHERGFVLEPLVQIAPELVVPGLGRSVRELWEALPDRSRTGAGA
jgi:2-amino-4-hydroxy-6-hydroxymethyldihydropteridine diphosphokinase